MKKNTNVLESVISRNKAIIVVFLLALIISISFLVSIDSPEWFTGAHSWFEFAYNISLSIIAGFIFYCYQVIIPSYKKDNIRVVLMKYELKTFYEYLDTFYRYLTFLTDYYEGYNLETTNFLQSYPKGFKELYEIRNDKTNDSIMKGLLHQVARSENTNYIKSIDNFIDKITTDYIDYLDADVAVKLLEMKNETYIVAYVLNQCLSNISTKENELKMIEAVRKIYETLRSLQNIMDIEPQYDKTTFEKIVF